MADEMLYAKIAYMIPFSNSENGIHEPALRIISTKNESVKFSVSVFFIGLKPNTIYQVSCSVTPADELEDFPIFVASKKFQMDDVHNLGGYLPSAFDIPMELNQPIQPGQYRIEAKLRSENSKPEETRKSFSFIEIEIIPGV
ncbi:hypothetical protein AAHW05_10455 [Klebsiella variicola subsp. variicola]|uniref:hypothetical protein n=1 Tax=Klebsiella variicola TaxID=244366 RepID=UPI00236A6EB4|nr:hypothetical protein [Klebsiella variicola]